MDAAQQQAAKRAAALAAAALVEPGMVVGLGTGSTAQVLVEALAQRVHQGLSFVGVPTSQATAQQARSLGLRIMTPDDAVHIDLALDGADEVDPQINAIKGLGGALYREKVVASMAARFVLLVDESKLVAQLGTRAPLPVEVLPVGWRRVQAILTEMGAEAPRRLLSDGQLFVSDNGGYLLDCRFRNATQRDWPTLATSIKTLTGVVEHGLFWGIAQEAMVGYADGTVHLLSRP